MLGMVCDCYLMLLDLALTVTLVTECLFVCLFSQFRYGGQESSTHCNSKQTHAVKQNTDEFKQLAKKTVVSCAVNTNGTPVSKV